MLDGMKMTRLVRRNSYDEAIGEFFTAQRKDSFSSNSSKGNGSPKLVHMKRSRSGSISKKLFSQFGRDGSKRRTNRDPREYQKQPEAEASATEEKQPEEKDDGYTVKRGNTSQQNKFLQKLTVDSPDSFERRSTMAIGKAASMKERRSRAPSHYSRRFDNMSNSRSSSRMHQHSCSITGTIQLVTDWVQRCRKIKSCRKVVQG